MELIVYSALDGLASRLEGYRDLAIIAPSKLDQARRLIVADRPPHALYVDDTRQTPTPDLWELIRDSHTAGVRVFVNMVGSGQVLLNDARALGVTSTTERDAGAVAAWIGAALGIDVRVASGVIPVVAVGAAKGGIGKTFVTCLLAEGLRRRGLRVLVWDSDISNPGLVPAFRVESSAPSYLHLVQRGPAQWNPTGIAPFVYRPAHTAAREGWGEIAFLIGSHTIARAENDVRLPDWQGLYAGVTQIAGFDLVLIDTPPDYLRRPYATHTLLSGGTVVLPCPPGSRERMGVGHMLDHFREVAPERLNHTALLFMEPERGVVTKVETIIPLFASRYPEARVLGTLPRAPRISSLADEYPGYISMLDLGAATVFAHVLHRMVDSLIVQLGLTPTQPIPKLGAWASLMGRIRGERISVPAAHTSVGSLAPGDA
jgi:cellulose biosynthesis protein BcsQ